MTDLPEDLKHVIQREMARSVARGVSRRLLEQRGPDAGTHSLYPYQRDLIRRAREVWAGQYPTIRATTESTMTERRLETDTATATLLGDTLHVTVTRYNDDTGRVDVTTDRDENWSRFPVSGAEAMSMIAAIRSGEVGHNYGTARCHESPVGEQIAAGGTETRRFSADVVPGSLSVRFEDDSPWSENDGTIPVERGTLVDVQWRNGEVHHRQEAGRPGGRAVRWGLRNGRDDIVAWRLSADAEEQEASPREGRTLIDFDVQGDRIKVYATGEHGYGLSVEGISVLHDVTGEQMARMVRDLRSWLGDEAEQWTDGYHLFIEEDSDADIRIHRIADNGGRGEKITEGFCRSGFAEAVETLEERLSVVHPQGPGDDAPPAEADDALTLELRYGADVPIPAWATHLFVWRDGSVFIADNPGVSGDADSDVMTGVRGHDRQLGTISHNGSVRPNVSGSHGMREHHAQSLLQLLSGKLRLDGLLGHACRVVLRPQGEEEPPSAGIHVDQRQDRDGSPSSAETWLANPGERPVEANTLVDVQHWDGDVIRSIPARHQCWSDAGNGTIVAWRRSETGTNPGEETTNRLSAPFAPNPGYQPPGVHSDTRVDVVFKDGDTHQDAPARFWKWDRTLLGWRYAQDERGTEDASPDTRPTEAHGLHVVDHDPDGRPMIEVPRSRLGLGGHGPGQHRCWPLHIDRLLDTGGGNWLRVQLESGMTVRMSASENPSDEIGQHSDAMVSQLSDLGLSKGSDVWIRFVDREGDAPAEDHRIPNPQPLRRTPEVMDLVRTVGSDGTQVERTVSKVEQGAGVAGRIATTVYVRGLGRMGLMWDEDDQRFQHKPIGASQLIWLAEPRAPSEDTPTDPPVGYRYVQHVPRIGEHVLSVCEGGNDPTDRTVTRVEEDVSEPTKVAIDGLTLNWFLWDEEHQRFQQGPNVIYLVQRDRR